MQDEALITGDYCASGEAWLRGMLLKMSRNDLTENAYGIPLYKLLQHPNIPATQQLDCFLGGLIAIGIAPQINQPSTVAVRPLFSRVRYWLQLFRVFGSATAASIQILNQPAHAVERYPDTYPPISALVGLHGGSSPTRCYGLLISNTSHVSVVVPDNSTLVVRLSWGVPFANVSFGQPCDTATTVFAASNVTVFMGGGFWLLDHENVVISVLMASGQTSTSRAFAAPMTGQQTHALECGIGDTVTMTKEKGDTLTQDEGRT